ncbi:MAG: starch-binding protein [Lachnospiraceae bacterium]|nr:starch-binding protein [Lachnospiraceae bacterium]
MSKLKKITSRSIAFVMALALICSGIMDNVYFMSSDITNNISGKVTAEAAETTSGTVNADTFSWDNALVYFLLTDRFKNGDTSNDHSYNRGLDQNGNVIQGVDDRATFHGGDFKGITQTIKDGYFNNLGVNALWISAPYEQIHGYIVGSDDKPSFAHYSYHGYYVLDYTDTDANFGTMEDFQELVDTAHEHGLRVIIDIVLNHAGYNSLYDMNEYGFGEVKTGWDDYYFSMSNVNNTDYHSYIDYEGDASLWGKWWGPDWVRAGLPGYTEGGSSPITQSLAGLPDFKTESTKTVEIPEFLATKWKQEGRYDKEVAELKAYLSSHGYDMTVTNCISYWLSTWVRDYGVDGFRCDTAKHVEYASWKTLETMCTEALKTWKTNNPDKKLDDLDFWMTGEAWDHGVGYDEYYTQGGFDSMINFETWGGGVLASGVVEGTYDRYASEINTKDDFNALSFISSHDAILTRGDMIYIGSAFLLLPGGVQIYYGDETNRGLVDGIPDDGNGGAGHSLRSDMNWDTMDEAVLAHWQKVGTFRSNHMAVGAGDNNAVETTSGKAFTRTYSKGNVKDRVALCIGASANTQVTIDVTGVWSDGESVVNYYDASSAVVTGGKVTFNSGANGTILVGDPDGKPLVSFVGNAKFKGTQQITVSLAETDSATVSVDGGRKFIVHNGDAFTIGETAYEGDTVTISYTATNEKGTSNGKATFYKAYADEDISDREEEEEENKEPGLVRVKMADGSAPYLYVWDDAEKAYAGAWPGTQLTEKDDEGYYYYNIDTTGKYNVIFNGNNGQQTGNIKGLSGKVTFEVASGYSSYTQTGGSQSVGPTVKNTITIHVKPYSSNSPAPHLYVWSGEENYNGGFPGNQLTEKDENGDYVLVIDGVASVTCIVSYGSNQNQSDNISGISGEAWITINSADTCKGATVEKAEKVESKYTLMKKEARAVKNMIQEDYTSASWNKLYSYIASADELVALGEEEADMAQVEKLYNDIVAAKNDLVLVAPTATAAAIGSKVVSGVAPCESIVKVTVNGTSYTATADEVTGVWSIVAGSDLSSSSIIETSCTRNGLESATGSYTVPITTGNGNVIVIYTDESGNEIAQSKVLTGTLGASYTTTAVKIEGYTLKSSPANATGVYAEADVTVTYVYQKSTTPTPEKKGKVIVRYVDESDNEIKTSTTLTGVVGEDYETAEADIAGYTLKTSPENAKGKYTEADITVTYVYQKNNINEKEGKVIVRYVDESDKEIKTSTALTGIVGADYETAGAEIEGYTLKTSPENAKGKYTEADITVTYVYQKSTTPIPEKTGKVIVRYVDESDKEIKASTTLTGTVGADYETAEAEIEGYTLKTSPANTKGKYTEADITVTYVYQKSTTPTPEKTGKVIVRYVDESDKEIKASTTLTGTVGANYETAEAEIEGYTLKTSPANAKGKYTESDITVTYVYKKNTTTEYKEVSISSFKMSKASNCVTVGQTVRMTAKATGGDGELKYKFVVKRGNKNQAVRKYSSDNSCQWIPAQSGKYTLYVYVKDSSTGKVVKKSIKNYNVKSALKIKSFTQSRKSGTAAVGDKVIVKVNATGGIGQKFYRYYYKLNGKKYVLKENTTSKKVNWTPKKAGKYQLFVEVTDDMENKITKKVNYVVVNKLKVKKFKAAPSSVKAGQKVKLSVAATGGTKGYSYKFTYKYKNKSVTIRTYSRSSGVMWTPKYSGKYKITVYVKDAKNRKATKTVTLNVK